jgi:hypothetical protein
LRYHEVIEKGRNGCSAMWNARNTGGEGQRRRCKDIPTGFNQGPEDNEPVLLVYAGVDSPFP